ncbi:hypothetical protein ASPVEDRAFT_504878 [Aspergillus versicolor CBS 583.65]|uniref:Uncharacterized protein n=1 Tax=Aspergillus versicolor CBS 583.65 TaxID=1036611 RepID=A0A1L9PCC0_ASPVE|nr:uncharacterized protein ASPVEDRAFT_504878 [Aspergillus versicolor CBS 583.65]OJI99170.1 hypothetical protein ASPVEDRAFT_504878 [Aspergillus versicolor CBS 583.65]
MDGWRLCPHGSLRPPPPSASLLHVSSLRLSLAYDRERRLLPRAAQASPLRQGPRWVSPLVPKNKVQGEVKTHVSRIRSWPRQDRSGTRSRGL